MTLKFCNGFINKHWSPAGGVSSPSRAPCRIRAGPRLVVGLGQGAELGRGRGGASRCSKAGRPVRPGCPVAFGPASQGWTCTDIGRRGREADTIGSRLRLLGGRCRDAGASRRSGARGADGTGRAGAGAGARGGVCAASRPGRGSGAHGWPGGARGRRSAGRPQVRGRSLAPGGAAGFRPSASTFPRTRGLQVPSRGQREVSEPRFPYL